VHIDATLVLALLSGIAIAAACGLRAFLPLFAVGLAARQGWIQLHHGSEWLAGAPALWAFGTAAVLEIAADKIPIVDHALDAIGTLLRPLAGALGAFAVLRGWGEPWAGLASVALASGALVVHGAKAKARFGSTVLTLGHANPLLSIVEDLTSLGLLVAAFLAPVVAVVLVIALLAWAGSRATRPDRARPSAGPDRGGI
jgi:uncharacterized membrane protein